MKTHAALLIALCAFASAAQDAPAQTTPDSDADRSIKFTHVRRDTVLSGIIRKDRPTGNKEIPVPHFAIHTADNKFVMTIGGQVNPIIGCDFGNDLYDVDDAGINFVTNAIPVPSAEGKRSDFYINALNADVDFEVVGLGGTRDQITGYIKFGTNGISNGLKMKKAYVSWRGFTAGMKSTLFKDNDACQPPTIDPQGPSGLVGGTAYEISYITPRYKGLRAALGVAIPTYYSSNGRYYGHDFQPFPFSDAEGKLVCDPTAFNQNVPDIPLWVEWQHSENNRIRVSAIFRNFLYRDEVTDRKRHTLGWGVMLSGNFSPIKPLIFYLQAVYGQGIGNYIQDLSGLPLSFTPSDKTLGRMSASPMMGINIGATYNITPKWQVNAVVSEARIWSVETYAKANVTQPGNVNDYRYGFYTAANVFYNISSYFQVGLEYLYGHRQTWNAGGAGDNRIQAQFLFNF